MTRVPLARFCTLRELRAAGFHAAFLANQVGFSLQDLVAGGYTASELREAHYDATALKEVGFTAAALRAGGFTSRQLHMARYKMKDMREAGVPWQDLGAHMGEPRAISLQSDYNLITISLQSHYNLIPRCAILPVLAVPTETASLLALACILHRFDMHLTT